MFDNLKQKSKAMLSIVALTLVIGGTAMATGVSLSDVASNAGQAIVAVADTASSIATVNDASAYVFSSTGVTIESADVTAVNGSAMNAVGTQYEILKFIGLFLLLGAAGWVLNKILSIKIG